MSLPESENKLLGDAGRHVHARLESNMIWLALVFVVAMVFSGTAAAAHHVIDLGLAKWSACMEVTSCESWGLGKFSN